MMYIDSGADLTLLARDYGKLLGMNLVKNPGVIAGVRRSVKGISPTRRVEGWPVYCQGDSRGGDEKRCSISSGKRRGFSTVQGNFPGIQISCTF